MTPQEKANQLVDSMYLIISNNGQYTGEHSIPFKFEEAKKCALIAVDNAMDALRFLPYGLDYLQQIDYWEGVKQEIKKL